MELLPLLALTLALWDSDLLRRPPSPHKSIPWTPSLHVFVPYGFCSAGRTLMETRGGAYCVL